MFVDSHPAGLMLSEASDKPRFSRSMSGLGRILAIVVILAMAALSAGLLALMD
jgi:hypothetical protein